MSCYCGRSITFADCCEKFILGNETPTSAEDLMRSRYSAFCVVNMDYLKDTTDLQVRFEFDREANEAWARGSKFQKLEILNTEESGTKSTVEFKAYFHADNQDHVHHEVSTFRKSNGEWFYRAGRILPTST
jgi:SEC-C motif-containing protein